jgi:gamma-glutamyltranspeptidase
MDDFSAKAGVPNLYGLTGSEANSIAPGKRMLSSMTPTVVEKKRKIIYGGRYSWRIYHYHLCFTNHIERIRI